MKEDVQRSGGTQIKKLANELTYHKYLLNKDQAQRLFSELTVPDYLALHGIARIASGPDEKTYLKDLAEHLDMPLHRASDMAGKLKERGLVIWSHSGKGSEGTYLILTDAGRRAMGRQEEILSACYSRVIEKFGREELIRLLRQLERLEKIMDEEFAEKGGT